MDDLLGIGKIAEAFEKGTREVRELGKLYFEPVVREKGLLQATRVQRERMAATIEVCQEALCRLESAGISERIVRLKLVLPILEQASLEDDAALKSCWAGLLASSVTKESIHPSFPNLLAQLTPAEARILDYLYGMMAQIQNDQLREKLGIQGDEFSIACENLFRLSLVKSSAAQLFWNKSIDPASDMMTPSLTSFGSQFVTACRGPAKKKAEQ
jgi:Abortive infection alpha